METIKELEAEIKKLQEKAHENGWKCPIHISNCLNEYDYRRYVSKFGKFDTLEDVLKLIDEFEEFNRIMNVRELKVRIKGK